jgi:transposase-like protein
MSKSNRNDPRRGSASEATYSFFEFDQDFPDDAACLDWLVGHLYPEGIYCPKCQKVTKHHRVKARTAYSCQFCGHSEHPMVGTIFENSATSLRLWFHAMYLMVQTQGGISAKQMERELGVTYKTAWRMAKQIRTLLGEDFGDMGGEVEADETYVGGRRKGTPRGRPGAGSHKTAAFGMVERRGRVAAVTVPNVRRASVMPHITRRVLPSTMIYTDELKTYDSLDREGYAHERVKHSEQIYVSGTAHTNTIEGFWSLLKRGIGGVYQSVSSKHLQSYLDEYSFRHNHRDDVAGMFAAFLSRIEKWDLS